MCGYTQSKRHICTFTEQGFHMEPFLHRDTHRCDVMSFLYMQHWKKWRDFDLLLNQHLCVPQSFDVSVCAGIPTQTHLILLNEVLIRWSPEPDFNSWRKVKVKTNCSGHSNPPAVGPVWHWQRSSKETFALEKEGLNSERLVASNFKSSKMAVYKNKVKQQTLETTKYKLAEGGNVSPPTGTIVHFFECHIHSQSDIKRPTKVRPMAAGVKCREWTVWEWLFVCVMHS